MLGGERALVGRHLSSLGNMGWVMHGSMSRASGDGPFVSPSQQKSSVERAGKD